MPGKEASAAAVSSSASRRVDHDRKARCGGELELPVEERQLRRSRREVVEVVEPRLADGDHEGLGEELRELADPVRLLAARLMGVDAERGEDALLLASAIASAAWQEAMPVPIVMIRETPTARARSTRNAAGSSHPSRWACVSITGPRAPAGDQLGRSRPLTGTVQATGASRRGKSGGAASIPSVSAVRPYATSAQSTAAGCCSAARIAAAVSGT